MQQNYNQMAQGLASLGRGDDSMLMHITPDEFQDFNRMAQSAGMEHIPINPMTGLPEFGFGKIFKGVRKTVSKVLKSPIVKTILPIAAGAILGPAGYGVFSSALTAGLGVGGIAALATGDVMYGLSAGLGAYGGANLGSTLSNYGSGVGGPPQPGGWSGNPVAANVNPALVSNAAPPALASTSSGGLGDLWQGTKDLAWDTVTEPSTAWDKLKVAAGGEAVNPATGLTEWKAGTGYDAAMTVGGPATQVAMAAMAPDPEDIEDQLTDEEIDKLEGTNYDPTRRLDLSSDTGLRLIAGSPGLDTGTADGGLDLMDEEETGITYAAQGGLMRLANGGYLSGGNVPGDGMSDDIPARIGGTQEAALSEGEFVIPADVVSHLGNGSSNAGAKKLYAMMNNLRKARTGKEKQGKEINPYNYMPA
jgi:hypothetical protein